MLVLNRKRDQVVRLVIPPSNVARIVEITVCQTQSSKVRLGIDADQEIDISRPEALEKAAA